MHEASIVLSIISIVEKEAKKSGVSKVNSVTMCVGELTCVESQTMRGCFEVAVESGALAGAELIIESVKALLRCKTCGSSYGREMWAGTCSECGKEGMDVVQGRELFVKSFDAD